MGTFSRHHRAILPTQSTGYRDSAAEIVRNFGLNSDQAQTRHVAGRPACRGLAGIVQGRPEVSKSPGRRETPMNGRHIAPDTCMAHRLLSGDHSCPSRPPKSSGDTGNGARPASLPSTPQSTVTGARDRNAGTTPWPNCAPCRTNGVTTSTASPKASVTRLTENACRSSPMPTSRPSRTSNRHAATEGIRDPARPLNAVTRYHPGMRTSHPDAPLSLPGKHPGRPNDTASRDCRSL